MTHQPLKDAVTRRPFRPFTLHLSDGQTLQILGEDEIVIHPKTKKTMILFGDDGGFQIVDIDHITTLQLA